MRYVYCQVWWGCNVCRQWRAVVTAAAMRHSNPISLISPKWSSPLEAFPNYLTIISWTGRLIPFFFSESRRLLWPPSKRMQVFIGFCDLLDDLFPTTQFSWCFCIEAVVKMPEQDTEDRWTGLILKKLILRWPGERQCISAWCVKEQSGVMCHPRPFSISVVLRPLGLSTWIFH